MNKSLAIKKDYSFVDEKIYSAKEEVVEKFSNYFGMEFKEMIKMFSEYSIISEEKLANTGKNSKNTIRCYHLLKQQLAILSHKAINYLKLLQYIANDDNVCYEDEWFETILEQLRIFHFGQGMTGAAINELLIPLRNIQNQFQSLLNQINHLNFYQGQMLDELGMSYEERKLDITDCVVASNRILDDKTSLYYGKHRKILKK